MIHSTSGSYPCILRSVDEPRPDWTCVCNQSVSARSDAMPDSTGLPYTSFDHSKAHFYRYDEQVSLCLERHR